MSLVTQSVYFASEQSFDSVASRIVTILVPEGHVVDSFEPSTVVEDEDPLSRLDNKAVLWAVGDVR